MHPILFRIPVPNWNVPGIGPLHEAFTQGNIPIYSYGVMLGLSLVVGWYLTLWLAEKDGLPKETMANCYVVTALAAIVGSRVLYVLTNLDEFESFGDFFAFRRGGLVAYGGFLGGYLGSWGYLKLKKIPLMPWADVAVPSLASGLAITRIGCYLFGCDFGKPLSEGAPEFLKKIGTFPHWAPGTVDRGDGAPAWIQHVNSGLIDHEATHSLPVHPTQLYESLVGLALLALLMVQRKNQRFRGQIFMLFAFAYGFARFLLEIVRDDAERGLYGPELGAHILLPGSLALFAAGYSIGFANGIPNVTMRRLTQGLSFVPALVAFLAMRPGSFMTASIVQLSTSQWVGVLTAVAVSVAYMIYWKAAEAHPAEAMVINLKGFQADQANLEAKKTGEEEEPEADEAEEEEEAPRKKAKKKKAKKAPQEEVEAKFDDDEDEPSKKKEEADADEPSKNTDEVDEDEPSKAKEEVEAKFDDDEDEPSKKDEKDEKDEEK
jgi:phosphatidylglycerol:prolipoprotein diacylglycerol transferase